MYNVYTCIYYIHYTCTIYLFGIDLIIVYEVIVYIIKSFGLQIWTPTNIVYLDLTASQIAVLFTAIIDHTYIVWPTAHPNYMHLACGVKEIRGVKNYNLTELHVCPAIESQMDASYPAVIWEERSHSRVT